MEVEMKLAKSTIAKALIKRGFSDNPLNIMNLEDALQWEDREDYDTLDDLLDSVIEDQEFQLVNL